MTDARGQNECDRRWIGRARRGPTRPRFRSAQLRCSRVRSLCWRLCTSGASRGRERGRTRAPPQSPRTATSPLGAAARLEDAQSRHALRGSPTRPRGHAIDRSTTNRARPVLSSRRQPCSGHTIRPRRSRDRPTRSRHRLFQRRRFSDPRPPTRPQPFASTSDVDVHTARG